MRFESELRFGVHPQLQLKDLMKATYGIGRTVLAIAASSGKMGTFETVLAAVMNELDPTEVVNPLYLYG